MAWVTKDSTETYNQTPEPPREYTKAEKAANWWHYHWMAVVVAVLVVVFGVWIIKDTVFQTRPDVQVAYVGTSDLPTARQALARGADRCDRMREKMNHLLRTEDFTELEAALRTADGHLEQNAPEEAFGELRRAQVQVETLQWLARRFV